jgi:peptide/nickel transport system permease protein
VGGYVLGRLIVAAVLVFVVATLLFAFLHLMPGDPALLLLSNSGSSPPHSAVVVLRHHLGLDQPIPQQYVAYLGGLVHGDLGNSFQDGHPVSSDIMQRLPRTFELIVAATVLGVLAGVPLGTAAARTRGSPLDTLISLLASTGISLPVFVTGTLLILVVSLKLGWVSAGGYSDLTADPVSNLKELILPAVSIAFGLAAVVARMARSAVLDVQGQDWVRTARAKGLPRRIVLVRHIVRNAMTPVVTVVGLQLGTLLGGTVLVEYVFNWPGISSLLVQSAERRDYPEVQGIVLVIATLFILLNLVVDLTYGVLDPRVKSGRQ